MEVARTGECDCTGWPDNCFDEPKINPKADHGLLVAVVVY